MKSDDTKNTYAAIDLGSNSFHMVIAQEDGSTIRIIDSLRHPVRLGEGLDKQLNMTPATQERALESLAQFSQRLRDIPAKRIRAVGTNTLRRAKNRKAFMTQAEKLIGKPIEIISGREEARLIYAAVSHTLPELDGKRLVIDIGGGSTELVIGKNLKPNLIESVGIGCVSFSKQYFVDGKVTKELFKAAVVAAQMELEPIQRRYRKKGWNEAVGCSGTIKAVSKVMLELGLSDGVITLDGINSLLEKLCKAGDATKLELQQIGKDRAQVFAGGLAVLTAIIKTLNIDALHTSQVALREGLIFEMIGQVEHHNTQQQTIDSLVSRYSVDTEQAARVNATAKRLFDLVAKDWAFDPVVDFQQLSWAAQLHEVGLGISHTQYQKHGAYILENADLLGFSIAEQMVLAFLVRYHRRKLDISAFASFSEPEQDRIGRLLSLIRLAARLHRGRHDIDADKLEFKVKENQITVVADQQWLDAHPLTAANLEDEAKRLDELGVKLKIKA